VPCNFDLYRHIGKESCPIEPLPAKFDLRVGACGAISPAHISGIDFQKSGLDCILHKIYIFKNSPLSPNMGADSFF
jgi:hypothetical protein